MSEIPEELRYVMLYYYRKGKTAAKTSRKICAVYGGDAVSERGIQKWFARFRAGNFDVKDAPRSGRPITEKADEILQLVEQDRQASCQEIAKALKVNHMTVWNHLKRAGYTKTKKSRIKQKPFREKNGNFTLWRWWMISYDFRFELTQQQCLEKIRATFGDKVPSEGTIYSWYAKFKREQASFKDEFRICQLTSKIVENIEKMHQMIQADRQTTYEIQATSGTDMKPINVILLKKIYFRKKVKK